MQRIQKLRWVCSGSRWGILANPFGNIKSEQGKFNTVQILDKIVVPLERFYCSLLNEGVFINSV